MKKWLVFLLGFIVGIVFTFIISFVVTRSKGNNNGMTYFEQSGECLSTNNFQVLQVVDGGCALAYEVKWDSLLERYWSTDLLVLITNDNGEYYYDDQIIQVPKGKCMRQVGVYTYPTQQDIEKTVPIVELMNE